MFLISPYKAQLKLAAFIRERRLLKELTQEGLADRCLLNYWIRMNKNKRV